MKKIVSIVLAVCMLIAIACVAASAYTQVQDEWITSINCDVTNGQITFAPTSQFLSAGAHTWRIIIFNEAPELPNNDNGLLELYNRSVISTANVFSRVEGYESDTNYVCAASGNAPLTGAPVITGANNYLNVGQKYYAVFCANSDGANDWTWPNKAYEFTYQAMEAYQTSLNVGGTTLGLNLLDHYGYTPSITLSQFDGTTALVPTALGNAFSITTGPSWVNAAGNVSNYMEGEAWASYQAIFRTAITEKPTGFAFRVKGGNNTIGLAFEPQAMLDGAEQAIPLTTIKGSNVILVDANGKITEARFGSTPWNRNLIQIPAGFEGFVVIPYDCLATSYDKTESDIGTITALWNLSFFAQAASSTSDTILIYDAYWLTDEIPTIQWIKRITSEANGSATITLNTDAIPGVGTSWTEIAIFTEPQDITANSVIYSNKLTRNPGTFALCPASGNVTATIGPEGQFVYDGFVDGQTYYIYIDRCINNSSWDYITAPYVFTYEAPVAEEPTDEPTEEPTEEITEQPTEEPTEEITEQPTEEPSEEITEQPTEEPTEEITEQPTEEPTEEITEQPTEEITE